MTILNDETLIRTFTVIATCLEKYLFLKSKSLYGYTSAIYFKLEKNVDI